MIGLILASCHGDKSRWSEPKEITVTTEIVYSSERDSILIDSLIKAGHEIEIKFNTSLSDSPMVFYIAWHPDVDPKTEEHIKYPTPTP